MYRRSIVGGLIAVFVLAFAGVASASVTFDPATGTGFVGKGDVQLALGLNNAQLQQQAGSLAFTYNASSTVVTEVSWICTNDRNENLQQRERTTTTESSTVGVVNAVARVRNQITGFNLNGYVGDPVVTSSSSTEGPPLNSCPSGPWMLTTAAGDPVEVSSVTTDDLLVNGVALP